MRQRTFVGYVLVMFTCLCVWIIAKVITVRLKTDVVIGPTDENTRLTVGGDAVPDTNFGSLLHFAQDCRIGNVRRFVSVSRNSVIL